MREGIGLLQNCCSLTQHAGTAASLTGLKARQTSLDLLYYITEGMNALIFSHISVGRHY